MLRRSLLAVMPAALAACTSPDQVGQQVGQSLYNASVSTGHAIAVVGDRTGKVLQDAGSGLRSAVNPPPPEPVYAPPPDLPPPYVPDGFSPAPPVEAEPLPAPKPALGY